MIYLLVAWELVWKSIALWKAARHGHLKWFIAIFAINTFGILPLFYIFFFQKRTEPFKYYLKKFFKF
jgi:hypothetical protein